MNKHKPKKSRSEINYDKNMKAIDEVWPKMREFVEKDEEINWARTDDKDNLWITHRGQQHPLYDKEHALREVKKSIKGQNFWKQTVTTIIGMGLGHLARMIVKRAERGHHIIIIEPVPAIMRMALHRHDFSKAIRDGKLLLAPIKEDITYLLSTLDQVKAVAEWNIIVDAYAKLKPEYMDLTNFTIELLNQIRCNTGTVASSGHMIGDNDVANLPWTLPHRGVGELKDKFKGLPAILVSTGPSLAHNVHMLKDLQDNAVIIAVGQALRVLLAYDIRPDCICSVDFGEVNMGHYRGLLDEDVPLVGLNRTYAPLLKAYKGPKFISATPFDEEGTAHSLLKDKGHLEQGGSVAHMVFQLGIHMGCDPIIMVGQDLALGETSHIKQADAMGELTYGEDGIISWDVSDPRSSLVKGKEDTTYTMGPVQMVPGYFGEPVKTNVGLASFITSFETMIKNVPDRKIINATEGGAHIKGAEPLFLFEVEDKFLEESIDKVTPLKGLLCLADDAKELIGRAPKVLRNDIETMTKIIESSEKGIKTSEDMLETRSEKDLKNLFAENQKHTAVAYDNSMKIPAVQLHIFGVQREIASRRFDVSKNATAAIKDRRTLRINVERNILILEGARDAARSLKKIYKECLDLFEKAQDDPSVLEPTGETTPPDLNEIEKFFDKGNFANPLLTASRFLRELEDEAYMYREYGVGILERSQDMREDAIDEAIAKQAIDRKEGKHLIPLYWYKVEEGQRIGREDQDHEKALPILREASELQPHRKEARWGIASALFYLGQWEESVEEYKGLVFDFPDDNTIRFEWAQAILQWGQEKESEETIQTGLEQIGIVMKETREFDGFLPILAQIYENKGNTEKAIMAYEIYIENNPQDKAVIASLQRLKQE